MASFLGILVGIGSTRAQPADAPEEETFALEEVIITARMIRDNVQDVPVAVNTISAETQQSSHEAQLGCVM